jgi:hypothetical protein
MNELLDQICLLTITTLRLTAHTQVRAYCTHTQVRALYHPGSRPLRNHHSAPHLSRNSTQHGYSNCRSPEHPGRAQQRKNKILFRHEYSFTTRVNPRGSGIVNILPNVLLVYKNTYFPYGSAKASFKSSAVARNKPP